MVFKSDFFDFSYFGIQMAHLKKKNINIFSLEIQKSLCNRYPMFNFREYAKRNL
jgi:hypothetical protein